MGTDQGVSTQSDDVTGPRSTEPVTLVRFAVYCEPDDDPAGGYDQHGSGSGPGTGRFFIVREVAPLHDQADIEAIESLGDLYEAPGVSSDLREKIKGAAADYAAAWTEGRWDLTWWQTPQSFPLAEAADLLDDSADWLRGLVEHPLDDVLSAAGADGLFVPVVAGITARVVTGPVTERLERAACVCEVTRMVIGTLVGAHALVMACAKPLLHGVANKLLGSGFERAIDSLERSLRVRPDREIEDPSHHVGQSQSVKDNLSRVTVRSRA